MFDYIYSQVGEKDRSLGRDAMMARMPEHDVTKFT